MALVDIIKKYFQKTTNSLIAWVVIVSVLTLSMGMPWPPDQVVHAGPDANMILFWDGGSAPSGWSIISDGAGENFLNRYVRAGGSYGVAEGGSATHTHALTYVGETTGGFGVYYDSNKGEPLADIALHTHGGLSDSAVSSNNNLPSYRSLKVIQSTATVGSITTIPGGAIAIFEATSDYSGDSNWTTYSSNDGYFLRGGSSVTTGGNSAPTHSVASGLSATVTDASINPSSDGEFALTRHAHETGGNSTSDGGDAGAGIEPPYVEVVFAKATADDTTWPSGMICGFNGTQGVSGSWDLRSDSGDTYYQKFIKGDSITPGGTGGATTHDHANLAVTSGAPVEVELGGNTSGADTYYADSTHTHSVTVNFVAADHTPQYWDLVLAEYTPVYTPETKNWRWFDAEDVADPNTTNGGDTVTGNAMAAEDTLPGKVAPHTRVIYKNNAMKLRTVIGETGGAAGTDVKYWLQFDTTTLFLSATTVAASGSCGTTAFCYYNGDNVVDDGTISTTRLSGSPTAGRHNEDSDTGTGFGDGSTFDPAASTDYEHEFTITNNNATANTVYYFRVQYCESSQGASCSTQTVALGGGELYPQVQTTGAYDLETYQVPANVSLGNYTKGDGGALEYVFQAGEEVVFWDKRGTSATYSVTVNAFSMTCASPVDTIAGEDVMWVSLIDDLSSSFSSNNDTIEGQEGGTLDSNVTAYNVGDISIDLTSNKGGFFFLPTMTLNSLDDRAACNFTGTLQITIA